MTNISSPLCCEPRLQQLRRDAHARSREHSGEYQSSERGQEVGEMGAQSCTTRTPRRTPWAGHMLVVGGGGDYLDKVNTRLFSSSLSLLHLSSR